MSVFRLIGGLFPEAWARRWPHIRGGLIAFHVVAVLLLAFPAPAGVMSKDAWKDPAVQNELKIFSERLTSLGAAVQPEELETLLWDASKSFLDVRKTILRPFAPYADYFGTRQDWRMFSAPHRYPSRLHIDLDRGDGKWEPIYAGRPAEAKWMAKEFDHHRMRRISFLQGWRQYRRGFQAFGAYLARRAAVDFPDAKRLRVRHYKYRTATPDEMRRGELEHDGKWQDQQVHNLEELR